MVAERITYPSPSRTGPEARKLWISVLVSLSLSQTGDCWLPKVAVAKGNLKNKIAKGNCCETQLESQIAKGNRCETQLRKEVQVAKGNSCETQLRVIIETPRHNRSIHFRDIDLFPTCGKV